MKKIIIPKDELVIAYNELQQKKLVAEKFCDVISTYVPECMTYKLIP